MIPNIFCCCKSETRSEFNINANDNSNTDGSGDDEEFADGRLFTETETEEQINNEQVIITDHTEENTNPTLVKNRFQVYLSRYKNFIDSPRIHFVYDTVFYTIFLLLFSYMMLCDFNYYKPMVDEDIHNHQNESSNFTLDYTTRQIEPKK